MVEKKEKQPSSNVGSFLNRALGQATNAVGSAARSAQNGGVSDSGDILSSLLGPGFDPSKILANDPMASQSQRPPTVEEQLLGTSMDVTGRYALTGQRYDFNNLPLWAQGLGRATFAGNPDLDPYLGIVSQQGDERVYLGEDQMTVAKYFDELDDSLDVNAKDPKKRAKAREQNQRIDTANKVDRQLGGDPTQEVAGKKKIKGDGTATATQVKNQPFLWDEDQVAATMKRMRLAGIPVKSFDDMAAAWGSLVDRASTTYSLSAGQKKITPWDVLDMYKSEAKASGSYVDYEQRMNGSQTSVSRSVSEVTEGEAFTALQSKLSEMLGRDPSDQEVRDFAYRMNHLAAQNPSITKTITRYKNGEAVGSNSTTHGGFSADDVVQHAYEGAQDDPHYAEYQSATTYFNAAMSALGGMGEG